MTFLVPGGGRVASSHWADGEYKETGQWSVLQSYNLSLSHISLLSRDINHTVSAVKWPLLIQRVKCIASRLHFLSVCLPWWRIMKDGNYGRRKGWTEDCHYLCLPSHPSALTISPLAYCGRRNKMGNYATYCFYLKLCGLWNISG